MQNICESRSKSIKIWDYLLSEKLRSVLRFIAILIFIFTLVAPVYVHAQSTDNPLGGSGELSEAEKGRADYGKLKKQQKKKKKKDAKKITKEEVVLKQKKAYTKAQKKFIKQHEKRQSKETRKQMRKAKRKAKRFNKRKNPVPWHKRLYFKIIKR